MKKYHKLPKNILELLPKAKAYLKDNPKVIFAYLFGGLVKRTISPLSDLDIAVYLSGDVDFQANKMELLGRVTELLKTDEIDLIILNTASLPLIARIIKDKKILVDKDPFLRHKFESLNLRKYFDFSIIEMSILKRRYSIG